MATSPLYGTGMRKPVKKGTGSNAIIHSSSIGAFLPDPLQVGEAPFLLSIDK
jgi:hypothetical protein